MFDLALLAILVLPLAAVHLAGHFMIRGFEQLSSEQQAARKQRANWIVGMGMTVQFLGALLVLEHWADQMPVVEQIGTAILSALTSLRDLTGKWGVISASFVTGLLLVALDMLLFTLVPFRLDRLARGIDGNRQAARQQVKLTLRCKIVTMVPVMAWSAAAPILLQSPEASMDSFVLLFLGYASPNTLFRTLLFKPMVTVRSWPCVQDF